MNHTSQTEIYNWCHVSLFIEVCFILSFHSPRLGGGGFLFCLQLHENAGGFLNAWEHWKSLESSRHCGHSSNIIDEALIVLLLPAGRFLVMLGVPVLWVPPP